MGTPVTSLSLSASQDLLATAHINKRGVFLWSNQLMFGDPSAVATYTERPVPVHLPSIAAPGAAEEDGQQQDASRRRRQQQQKRKMKQHQRGSESESEVQSEEDESSSEDDDERLLAGREVRLLIDGGALSDSSDDFFDGSSSSSDDGSGGSSDEGDDAAAAAAAGASSSDSEGAEGRPAGQQPGSRSGAKKRRRAQRAAAAARAAEAEAMAAAAYRQVDGIGAPTPLAPHLATLSLLPRSQASGRHRASCPLLVSCQLSACAVLLLTVLMCRAAQCAPLTLPPDQSSNTPQLVLHDMLALTVAHPACSACHLACVLPACSGRTCCTLTLSRPVASRCSHPRSPRPPPSSCPPCPH